MNSNPARSRHRSHQRFIALAWLPMLVVLWNSPARAQLEVWTSPTGGNWSNGVNWLDGSPPNPAGSSTLTLQFATTGLSTTSTDDLLTGFQVNNLIFENPAGAGLVVAPAGAQTIVLSGTNAHISQAGGGRTTITVPLVFNPADNLVTIDGASAADLTLFGTLSGLGANQTLRIAGATTAPEGPLISLTATNTLSGTVELDSGNLALTSGSLGSAKLRIEGGTLHSLASNTTQANAIELGSDLVITSTLNMTLSGAISSLAPTAGLTLRTDAPSFIQNSGTLRLTGVSTYMGATTIDFGPTSVVPYADAGVLRLSGNGSVLNTSLFEIRTGGTLAIETLTTGPTNRVADATPIFLRGGRLLLDAVSASALTQSETVGPISVSGFGSITVGPTGRNVDLTAASLTRLQHGTVLFRSPTLSGPAGTAARIFFGNAAAGLVGGGGTGPNVSILPYAIGDTSVTGTGIGFVTYDAAGGVRLLDAATEYAPDFASATPTSNVRLTASTSLPADTTVNSLLIAGGSSVAGSSTLTVTSGAVLVTHGVSIDVPLQFGVAEAQIFAASTSPVTISKPIFGSGGLTKSGVATLTLLAANPFTGPLTIDAGKLAFTAMDQLGADQSAIGFYGGTGSTGSGVSGESGMLSYIGTGTLSLTRPLEIGTGFAGVEALADGGVLMLDAPITGAGGLVIGTYLGPSKGTVRLNTANTYTGPTVLTAGITEFADDAVFGAGDLWIGATLKLLAPWTTSRAIRPLGGTLDTNGFDATWNGLITGSSGLTKIGAGTLTLTADSPFWGGIQVKEGRLLLRDNAAFKCQGSSFGLGIYSGAELELDETTGSGGRLPRNALVYLTDGRLRITGGANASREQIETLGLGAGSAVGTLLLSTPGAGSVTFQADTLDLQGSSLVVRTNALGGASGTSFTRFALAAPPAAVDGLSVRLFAAPLAGTGGETFTTYDSTSDAAGVIGLKSVTTTPTTLLQNPAVPTNAHVVIEPGATAGGSANTVRSLTFETGGTLLQSATQTLSVASGQVLVRSGGSATLSGGTLAFGAQPGTVVTLGDFVLDAAVTGTAGWTKTGAGTLTLGAQPTGAAAFTAAAGKLRALTPTALATFTVGMSGTGTNFDLNGADTSLGGLTGAGTVQMGGATLTLGGAGQDFSFNGTFTGGGQVTIVDGGNPNAVRKITLTSTPTTPTFTLASGHLQYGVTSANPAPFPLTLAGGELDISNGATFNLPLVLTGDTLIGNNGYFYLNSPSITGPGNLHVQGNTDLYLQVPSNHTGETIVQGGGVGTRLRLLGTTGAINSTSAVRIHSGELYIDYTFGATGRINDTAPVFIRGGDLTATGPRNAAVVEQIGALHAGPNSEIVLAAQTDQSTASVIDLRTTALVRDDGGVFKIRDSALGATGTALHTEIHSTTAPAMIGGGATSGADTSIIPWMFASRLADNYALSLVSYDPARGLYSLDRTSDFAQGLAAVTAPTNNLALSGAQTINAPVTVNSLLANNKIGTPNLTGTGTLTVSSGAVVVDYFTTLGCPLAFGPAEAVFVTEYPTTVSGPISGTGGLTMSGSQTLTLSGVNTFTGPLRIVKGPFAFTRIEAIGPDTGPITLDGGGFNYTGTDPVTISRPFIVGIDGGTISTGNSSQTMMTVTGEISGAGPVTFGGNGPLLVSGNNSFTGDATVGGNVKIASDEALGKGALRFSGGTLEATFNWTTSRTIYPSSNANVSTGNFDSVWNGPVLGQGALTKYGAGRLTVHDASQFFGSVLVQQGVLEVDGPVPRGEPAFGGDIFSTNSGGTLAGTGVWERNIRSFGRLDPGNGIGTLSVRDVEMDSPGTLDLEIASPDSYDQLIVRGSFQLDGSVNLAINLTFDPIDSAKSFLVVDNDGTDAITGAVPHHFMYQGNDLDEGELFSVNGHAASLSYVGGDGNDVVITIAPEPSSSLFLLGALSLLVARRRRTS